MNDHFMPAGITGDAMQHLDAALKSLCLEAFRADDIADMSPVEHFTIAEDLARIDGAIGPKGESIFAKIADSIQEAYVEILAARALLTNAPATLRAENAPIHHPEARPEGQRPPGAKTTATSASPQTSCFPEGREAGTEHGQHAHEDFSDAQSSEASDVDRLQDTTKVSPQQHLRGVDQDTIDRVAAAIDSAELGYSMRQVRLVDGINTYTLTIGGMPTEEFTDSDEESATDQLYARIREVKQRKQAEAVIVALSPAPQSRATVPAAAISGLRRVIRSGVKINAHHYGSPLLVDGDDVFVLLDPDRPGVAKIFSPDQAQLIGVAFCPELIPGTEVGP